MADSMMEALSGGKDKAGEGDKDADEERQVRAEELGRLIEEKDWMGVLDLLEPSTALLIGIGAEDDEL
jgi:hypothetical protein